MFQRNKQRRFRRHPNGRNHQSRINASDQLRLGSNVFSNGRSRNNFKPQQSAEKLFEKYNDLAKEALSSGDKILSESYFQHADHFMRIISEKNLSQNQNQNQNKITIKEEQTTSSNNEINKNYKIEQKKE